MWSAMMRSARTADSSSGRTVESALICAMSGAKSSVSKTVAQPFIMQMVRSTPMPVSTLCCLSGS
ncbi:MAG: hypothetical protein BWX70_03483 [Verrucomicrobia bacterium ADurb.Bin070]|nr:MAG: hypothetical protein BWX70_03483 [Verrucomicrobia bacterium ADurb.Bin070]